MRFFWVLLLFSVHSWACTLEVPVQGAIGSGTLDLLERAQSQVQDKSCSSVLLLINTPGGSVDSTRRIVELILNSKVPYLCLVYPDGGHAGSAGAIILQACHVNGAMAGTNLGAATPILGTGESLEKDLRQKMLNDMTSWMDSLTALRARNQKFGRDIVTEAKAVAAEEAQRLGAIDFVVSSKGDFLTKAADRSVTMTEGQKAKVVVGDVVTFALDVRFQILSLLSDPQIAYLMFLGSLALLYFEFTHPGTIVAGVVGGFGLILSLVALHKLNVEWGGVFLILLGIALLIAEIFVTSFGALGIGGLAAFIVGSVFLFDPAKTGGYVLPWSTILMAAGLLTTVFLGVGYLVLQTLKLKRNRSMDDFVGRNARVSSLDKGGIQGFVELQGELWMFESSSPVSVGDMVTISGMDGLKLKVKGEKT